MQTFINHLRTELFISARFNFVAFAWPIIQLWTSQYWADDMSVTTAVNLTVINYFVAVCFSFPIGIYRQYLKT